MKFFTNKSAAAKACILIVSICCDTAVQNERQPRNSAQVRQDQLDVELQQGSSEHASLGCAVGPGMLSGATVSATHPAFTPVRPAHDGPSAAQQHRCGTANDSERRTGRKSDSEHSQQLTGTTVICHQQ